jgi:hypothetical protein
LQKTVNDCIYYVYAKYCDKDCAEEKNKFGYSDLTEHICEYKDCQMKCKNYVAKEKIKFTNTL